MASRTNPTRRIRLPSIRRSTPARLKAAHSLLVPRPFTRPTLVAMSEGRAPQLAYSEFQGAMLEEDKRRRKAAKLISVVRHFLGREDLKGLTVADVGCSAGFISDEL